MFQLQVETPHKPMGQTISKRTEGQHEVHRIHPGSEDRSLPAIIPLEVQGVTLWAYLDTGSGRNFISKEAVKKLNLKPSRHETRRIVTINGVQRHSVPIFNVRIHSLDDTTTEPIEISRSEYTTFTTAKKPTIGKLKSKYEHA